MSYYLITDYSKVYWLARREGLGKPQLAHGNDIVALEKFHPQHIAVGQPISNRLVTACHDHCTHWVVIGRHLAHVERTRRTVANIYQVVAALCHTHVDDGCIALGNMWEEGNLGRQVDSKIVCDE